MHDKQGHMGHDLTKEANSIKQQVVGRESRKMKQIQ